MRQETNNEIDLLLRRLSRGQGATAPDGDLHEQHLDADELNSYAENALPRAARARYTEHLAECSRCRELVVQLSSAAGVVVAEEPSRALARSGLSKFLASLFSPMVLHYAVPATGLIVFALIGFTVFRRQQPTARSVTSGGVNTQEVAQETKPPAGFINKFDSQEKSRSVSPTPEPPRRERNEAEAPAPTATLAATPAVASTPVDANKEAPVAKTESTAVASAAPAPAAPKPAETSDEVRKQEPGEQKKLPQDKAAATPQADRETDFQAGAIAPAGVASTRRPAKRQDAAQNRAAEPMPLLRDKDSEDAETRTAAGRRFRKERGIWVDTAYAGGATTDLARGSEQYRALVADEPEIKKIADQLDGQIVVVWKGRAYRIK